MLLVMWGVDVQAYLAQLVVRHWEMCEFDYFTTKSRKYLNQ